MGFFDYIRSFDIFSLLETHVVADKTKNFNKYFPNHEIYWIGRAIGGTLFGIKNSLKHSGLSCVVSEHGNFNIYKISIGNISFSLLPLYIRESNWRDEFLII